MQQCTIWIYPYYCIKTSFQFLTSGELNFFDYALKQQIVSAHPTLIYCLLTHPNLPSPPRARRHLTNLGVSTEDKRGKGGVGQGENEGMGMRKGRSV